MLIKYEISKSDYDLYNGKNKNESNIISNYPYYYSIKSYQYQQVNIYLTTQNKLGNKPFEFIQIYELGNTPNMRIDDCSENGSTPRNKVIWTEQYFKNFRNKHYSSSNNVHIKNKRKNKIDLLNKYYTQSQYSNDEPEVELIDRSVSSQTNSLNRKL